MKSVKKNSFLFLVFIGLLLIMVACTNNAGTDEVEGGTPKDDDESKTPEDIIIEDIEFTIDEPITLRMINWWPEETFVTWWKDPVEAKYPNVTLEQIPIQPTVQQLEEFYATSETADLFIGHFDHVKTLHEYDTSLDMSGLIERHGFDTEKFIPGLLDQIKSHAPVPGEINMFPFLVDRYILHYNKDIFDSFGVDYPTDDMLYSEIRELAAKVSGELNEINYYGLNWGWDSFDSVSGHLRVLDPDTLEPTFTTDERWSEFFTLVEDTYNIAGNLPEEENYRDYIYGRFAGDRNLAMVPLWSNLGMSDEFNWDIVTYPTWEGTENQVPGGVGFGVGVTATSEYPDEAFHVLKYLLSEEAVIERYHSGDNGGNINQLVYNPDQIGIDVGPDFEGLNYDALFKKDFLPLENHPFERTVFFATVVDEMHQLLYTNRDVNTHLRQLTEMAEVMVEDLLKKE